MKNFPLTEFIWVLKRVMLTSFSHSVIQSSTADVAVRARLIVTESPQTHWQKDGTEQDFMNNETLEIWKYGTDVQTTDGDLFSAVIL